jgi:hypothetical protein
MIVRFVSAWQRLTGRLLKKGMRQLLVRLPMIPPTQLVDCSYPA